MNKPHVHAAVIKAWADGAQIQYRPVEGRDSWVSIDRPSFDPAIEYRVQPEPEVVVLYGLVGRPRPLRVQVRPCATQHTFDDPLWTQSKSGQDNLKLTFEDGKLVAAEVLK